jgi:hypothetical protein
MVLYAKSTPFSDEGKAGAVGNHLHQVMFEGFYDSTKAVI